MADILWGKESKNAKETRLIPPKLMILSYMILQSEIDIWIVVLVINPAKNSLLIVSTQVS